jgi:hypothetical protein
MKKNFTVFSKDGTFLRSGICLEDDFLKQKNSNEILIEGCFNNCFYDIKNKSVVKKPKIENKYQVWNKEEKKYVTKKYYTKRKLDYPLIEDQLDALWHGMDNGIIPIIPDFYYAIKEVKTKHPKE